MTNSAAIKELTGTIHGKRLELDDETGLPDGQQVTVSIKTVPTASSRGEAMSRAFGGWSDDLEGVDRFVEEVRQLRNSADQRELES